MSTSRPTRRMLVLCLVVLAVFALCAPSVRLMLIHDDAVNANWMNGFTLLSIFSADWSQGGASARPMANALWILIRELFGWYIPPLIHMWNVFLHVLNTVLVASLAMRLGHRLSLPGLLFPTLSALVFALFPLSFQSVIWAGAIYHPVMATFGLFAVHASLNAREDNSFWRWTVATLCVLAASLSHESGFLFGGLALFVNAIICLANRRRLPAGAIVIGAITLVYPIVYRLALATGRFTADSSTVSAPFADIFPNAMYFMQGAISWLVILARPIVGLTDAAPILITLGFVIAVALALVFLSSQRTIWLGILALGWWALMSALPAIMLTKAYVSFGPRLLYVPSIGIALFWSAVTVCVIHALRRPWLQLPALAGVAFLLAWCVPYILDRMRETERLTPAMIAINDDLRESDAQAKVLLINLPWWNAPTYPSFLVGAEGMPIFQHDGAPAWTWLATVSGTRRDTSYIRHELSLTRDERWQYGQPGATVDDAALRDAVFKSNLVYRFDYDPPGLRAQRLAMIQPYPDATLPDDYVAALSDGNAQVAIRAIAARTCAGRIRLDIGWWSNGKIGRPAGVFVHGLDAEGQQALAADRDLLNGVLPLDQLPNNLLVDERREIDVPGSTDGISELRIGVYRREGLKRFTATKQDGTTWLDDAIIVPVQTDCDK